MKRILCLPFLSISSGHHQVSDALIAHIMSMSSSVSCRKVDLLRYSYGNIETAVSQFYLKWIKLFPQSYSWIYHNSVVGTHNRSPRFRTYELLFHKYMVRLIREERPELIFCTHALPSYLLNELKKDQRLSIPVVNVYTDFFINSLWGLHHIDYHFVPGPYLKRWLMDKGVEEKRIFVTGIPVHPEITSSKKKAAGPPYTVLMTAGSLGVGAIRSLIKCIGNSDKLRYIVLCGRNKRFQKYIEKLQCPNIIPLPYISSREQMNDLYDQVDLILTKSGGITISESLRKTIPILVYDALPGQEQVNLEILKRQGLIFHAEKKLGSLLEQQVLQLLDTDEIVKGLRDNMDNYLNNLADKNISLLLDQLIHSTL